MLMTTKILDNNDYDKAHIHDRDDDEEWKGDEEEYINQTMKINQILNPF